MAADSSSVAFGGLRPHRLMWLGIGILAMLISALLSLRLGVRLIGWADIGRALFFFDPDTADHIVLWQIRLPRMVGALLCGGCLGGAGALMQALTRNPLADPGLLGVNAGAALGVVICTIALGLTDPAQFIWAALAGAAIASALVFALGGNAPSGTGRLILAGAAVSALFYALIRGLLLVSRSSLEVYRVWVLGGFDNVTFDMVATLMPFLVVGLVLAFAAGFSLNALQLGESTAQSLGVRVGFLQLLTGAAIVLLCGTTVAMAGPIAFIGLIVPHLARVTAPADMRWLSIYSAVYGATLMALADLIARSGVFGGNMQAGVMSAIIGGPVLIWLVRSKGVRKL
ncbi:ABC-type Fe3+-siderophore transport system inner membrane subunit [Tritonibacter mobilis]|uniref:FecCD family ABC transporter permease n=1 Tax=Tritonibacter mobilis TaxID=379347 RepID=UPI000F6EF204|nr:iron ABC transporter permease [Tritonibacter mobilis]VCU61385.1 ABC-type Fe3+-siderophore transport system inner membrane subunit [Tritonibacter mobilis]